MGSLRLVLGQRIDLLGNEENFLLKPVRESPGSKDDIDSDQLLIIFLQDKWIIIATKLD